MKKKTFREKYKKGFMMFFNENGEPETTKESYERMGIKIKTSEEPTEPNRKTRRTKKGDK